YISDFDIVNWSLYIKLVSLDLRGNQYKGAISVPIFYSGGDVTLDLSSNQINSIDVENILINEEALRTLITESSEIEQIRRNAQLQTHVKLDENPIICDCHLAE